MPAACITSAKICAENGDSSLGLRIEVQPVASAGNTFTAIWLSGQFHGVISPHTPIGSRRNSVWPFNSSNLKFFSTSIAVARWPVPRPTWKPFASEAGAPISSVIAAARSPARLVYSAMIAWSRSSRSATELCDQVAKALRAAFTAMSTSAAEPSEMCPATLSVAGFSTSWLRGVIGSTHLPSM